MKHWKTIALAGLLCLAGQSLAQSPEDLHKALPDLPGWTLSPDKEIFNPDNLFERINGAAPLYIENNFREMTSLEYTQGDNYITIQAYRHQTPEDAFGMYASERSPDMDFYPNIGGEAQGDGYGLFFFSGCIYVKMSASDETAPIQQAMLAIARHLAQQIDPQAAYPSAFSALPAQGRIPHTEAYITQNYIGHDFLKPAYTADYTYNDQTLQLFLIDAKTAENAQQMITQYLRFAQQTETPTQGKILIHDRYNGDIPLLWNDRYILGAFDPNGNKIAESIYEFLNPF
jgi:hypothetical protein